MTLTLRRMQPDDVAALARIFHEAVQIGAASHYTVEQRQVWSPSVPSQDVWARRLQGLVTFVALIDAQQAGFMSLRADGLLDLAFVAPGFARRGVGRALYGAVEAYARQQKLAQLSTEASHLARPFFLRHGWQEVARQTLCKDGVVLTNFRMEKRLLFGCRPAKT